MTLPSEQVYAINNTREFLRELSSGPAMKVSVIRARARSCLRHYPPDYILLQKWQDTVCTHGHDREFCRECKKVTGAK